MPHSKMLAFLSSIFLLMAMAANAAAQESNQTYALFDEQNQAYGVYETQQEAEAAIKNIPGPTGFEDAYQYANKIKGRVISEEGDLEITYWVEKKEAINEEWEYSSWNGVVSQQEAQAVADLIQGVNEYLPECGNTAQASPAGEWVPTYGPLPEYDMGMEIQGKLYNVSYLIGDDCTPDTLQYSIQRTRRSVCPYPLASWYISEQACANKFIVARIKTKAPQCDGDTGGSSGMVGNPCDVKTGEKFESEQDFDLGWINFTRYYHSGIEITSAGFGLGWSYSHQMHLAIGTSSLGLVEGSGYALPFREANGEYRAANGSGERILSSGGDWKLYRQDAVYTFDEDGRLVSRVGEDGNGLVYGYDEHGRLGTITSLQGRSIEFQYADASGDALIASISSTGTQLAAYTYDEGRLKTATYPDGGQRIYHYEDTRFPRHLTGITAEDGQRFSTFAYDAKGRAISSQHPGGADGITLSYASAGTLVTDVLGEQITYSMTDAGGSAPKVSAVTNSAGTASYTYYDLATDFRRRLDTETNRNGVITKHTYAEATEAGVAMNVHTVQEAFGLPEQRTTITRTAADSNRLLFVQSDRSLTDYTRNARLQPTSITLTDLDADQSRVTTIAYCESADVSSSDSTCPVLGLVKSIDGPRTDVSDLTQYAYYPADAAGCASGGDCTHRKGDLWKVTNALGQVTETLAYDGAGRALSVKDANGVVTQYAYSPRGWLTAIKLRGTNDSSTTDDRITTIAYWPTGQVKRLTQPDGAYTNYTYDAAHRLTDIADNAGNTIHYTLDNAGNHLKEDIHDASSTLKRTLSRVYNQLGQLVTQADAAANPTDFGYDANGNATSATDALGRTTQQDYDSLNRLKRTLQDVGGIAAETKLAYDALDNLTQVTDPKGLNTTYTYNGLGDLTQQVSPDTGTTSYSYDSAGNRATQTDARNKTTTYSHDALNRLTGMAYATTALNVTYTYDATQAVCATGESFPVGRLTRMQDGSGTTQYCYNRFGDLTRKVQTANGVSLELAYAYDPAGRLIGMAYPDGTVVDYVRDARGRIIETGVTAAGSSRQVLLTGATYHPFGPVAGWTYGNGRQMTRALDLDYRPASIHDGSTGGLSVGFNYDEVGNLVELTQPGSTLPEVGFGYDALGRLTQFKDGPTGTPIDTYGYDPTGNRTSMTTSAGTTAYTYPTARHRLASVGGTARTFDAAGNTTAIGGTARQFVYDDTGRMSGAKVNGATVSNDRYNGKGERTRGWVGSGNNTYTLYDESGHWLGDYDNAGTPIQQAIWLDDLPVGLRTGAAGTVSYIEPDHLGSPRVVIDPVADTAIWKWDLKGEAFGATAPEEDPDGNGTAFTLDLRFPGQRYDAATGLNYNYFRDYEPGTGRYVQSDPIGLDGGLSTYAYVGGNPISYVDPLGLEGVDPQHSYQFNYDMGQRHGQAVADAIRNSPPMVVRNILYGRANDMQRHNFIDGDKFYHCLAMCESAAHGPMEASIALTAGIARELNQQYRHGDPAGECAEDNAANGKGIAAGLRGQNCVSSCSGFMPPGMTFP